MKQLFAGTKALFYELQPGDATRYSFFFARLPEYFDILELDQADFCGTPEGTTKHMFSGWGPDTYILGLCIADEVRVAFPSTYAIENWNEISEYRLEEIGAQLGSTVYTAKVLLAALSVLIDDCADTPAACRAMMQARAILTS